jgi:hypothetical protein
MTALDVALIMGAFTTSLILCFVKASIHFDYLKVEKGKFKNAESLTYLIFRPIYLFEYLPETFVICHVPILWGLKSNKYRFKIGILSYAILALWTFVFTYDSLIG